MTIPKIIDTCATSLNVQQLQANFMQAIRKQYAGLKSAQMNEYGIFRKQFEQYANAMMAAFIASVRNDCALKLKKVGKALNQKLSVASNNWQVIHLKCAAGQVADGIIKAESKKIGCLKIAIESEFKQKQAQLMQKYMVQDLNFKKTAENQYNNLLSYFNNL